MKQTLAQKMWKAKHFQENKELYKLKHQKRRDEVKTFIESFKTECNKCGEDDKACLDFHHKNPNEKDGSMNEAVKNTWAKEKILKEINKCIILCSNCHRKLHFYA